MALLRWMTAAAVCLVGGNIGFGLAGRDHGRVAFFIAAGLEVIIAAACWHALRRRQSIRALETTPALTEWWAIVDHRPSKAA